MDSFKERRELVDFLQDYESGNFNYKAYIKESTTFNKFISLSPTGKPGKIDVLPSSYKTNDTALANLGGIREKRLDKALQKSGMAGDYDYVIIDTPPSATTIASNGLYAAQYVIIPSQMEYLSIYGIRIPIKRAKEVQEEMNNKRGKIIGIVPMMIEKNLKLNSIIRQLVEKNFKDIPILQEVKRTTGVAKASYHIQPIALYAEQNKGVGEVAKQLSDLTQQIVAQIDEIENCAGI